MKTGFIRTSRKKCFEEVKNLKAKGLSTTQIFNALPLFNLQASKSTINGYLKFPTYEEYAAHENARIASYKEKRGYKKHPSNKDASKSNVITRIVESNNQLIEAIKENTQEMQRLNQSLEKVDFTKGVFKRLGF